MRNLKKISIVGSAVLGLTLPAFMQTAAEAQTWKPTVFKVNDSTADDLARIQNGRLRKTDEEQTNEQAVVKFFGDNKNGLYIEMRSSALNGAKPAQEMQGACTPVQLQQGADGNIALAKMPGEKFISNNNGNENRNFNKPEMMPINGGKNMLVMYNYQPNNSGDTKRYAQVLDQNCNAVPLTGGQAGQANANGARNGGTANQVVIMAKNNDDCDMHQSGDGPCDIASDAGGRTHVTCWAGCNGNGRDDGWLNDVTVSCTNNGAGGASSCAVSKAFDISLAQREERSRGRCSFADADPNTAICTWTEGNNQPQRDGTWMAAIDTTPGGANGANVQSRLVWKQQLDGRKNINVTTGAVTPAGGNGNDGGGNNNNGANRRTYSVRANHTRLVTERPDGSLGRSDMMFFYSGDLEGRNNNNNKGGTYRAQQIAVIQANRAGLTYVMPQTNVNDMFLGIDATHTTMCGAIFGGGSGTDLVPGFTILQGSQNGGGAATAAVKAVGFDMATRTLKDLGTHDTGAMYDRHLYANYLGNNPGNQGRNFAGCTMMRNPFMGQTVAGVTNTDKYFLVHATTGKSAALVENSAMKPSSYIAITSIASSLRTGGRALSASNEAAGCTSTGGKSGLAEGFALLGVLGLIRIARRRK